MLRKNITYLIGGNAAAQVLTVAVSPILSRLYTPSDFGVLGLVLGASSIIAVAAHLRLNLAIAQAPDLQEAKEILFTALSSVLLISFISSLVIWLVHDLGFFPEYTISIVGLVFLASCLTAFIDIFNYWQSYRKRNKESAKNSVFRSVGTVSSQLALSGLTRFGLAFGFLAGAFIAASLHVKDFFNNDYNKIKSNFSVQRAKDIISKYRTFPLYSMPQGFLASASLNAVPIVLGSQYGLAVAGQYWFAYRLLLAPAALIGGAYRQVIHPVFSDIQKSDSQKIDLARRHTLIIFCAFVPVSIILFFTAAPIFSYIFGSQWELAGHYVGWLAICFGFDIVKIPSICIVHGLKKHADFLFLELMLFFLRLFALFFGVYFAYASISTVAFFAVSSLFFNIFVLLKYLKK